MPLEPSAAFLLRREVFPPSADRQSLVHRFKEIFHLTDHELNTLFEEMPEFPVTFDEVGFRDAIDSLPPDLHPPSPSAGQAGMVEASRELVALAPTNPIELIIPDVVDRRARRALARYRAIALVGPPGTGKSQLVDRLVKEAQADPDAFGLMAPPQFQRYTAETDWTARTVVGGYFPQADGTLVFREGHLLRAIRANSWLVLDEMNRADLDRVLGPILTFLAGQDADLELSDLGGQGKPMGLAWGLKAESGVEENDKRRIYVAGKDWRIIGTYNSVDLGRVFSMGSALSRRWATVPVPPLPEDQLPAVLQQVAGLSDTVIDVLRQLYAEHLTVLPIGPAPFLDMARYVVDDEDESESTGAGPGAVSVSTRRTLQDAYILFMAPQLRRLDSERRAAFIKTLAGVLGADLETELTGG